MKWVFVQLQLPSPLFFHISIQVICEDLVFSFMEFKVKGAYYMHKNTVIPHQPLQSLRPFTKQFNTYAAPHECCIFTDSQPVLQILGCFLCHNTYLALARDSTELLSCAWEKGHRTVLQWIPGQCRFNRNETASTEERSTLSNSCEQLYLSLDRTSLVSFQD